MATAEKIVHVSEFTNEPFIDFTKPENRTRMQEALKQVKAEFGREYPMWLNGHRTIKRRSARRRTLRIRWKLSVFSRMPRRIWPERQLKTPTSILIRGRKFRRRNGRSF